MDERISVTAARLRRVWGRAIAACALYLLVALALPPLLRQKGSHRERPRSEDAPEYVMPNGERRRAVVFTRTEPPPAVDRRGERALLWWCGILAAVTLGGAAAQTMRIRADARRGTD